MHNNRKTRLIIAGVLTLLALIFLHIAGLFIAAICWFWYGVFRVGVHIYKSGTHYIARTNAEEMIKAQNQVRIPAVPEFEEGK
jgi:hypothetical protein